MLYEKYRPQLFKDVIGQGSNGEILRNQVLKGKIAHSYLFEGNRGSGKTTSARILAKAINCENPINGEPCGHCSSCIAIDEKNNLDVIEIDAASNNGVDNIREIISNMKYAPDSKYKVYIIDEAHMLSNSAANAFLKILEEPPKYGVFILCTTDSQKLPRTIISRCQAFNFGRIKLNDIINRLSFINSQENTGLANETLELIAKMADGAMRDALSIMEQIISSGKTSYNDVVDILGITSNEVAFRLIKYLILRDGKSALETFYQIIEGGKNIDAFVRDIIVILRNIMVIKAGADKSMILMNESDINLCIEISKRISFDDVLKFIDEFQKTLNKLNNPVTNSIMVEMTIVNITSLSKPVEHVTEVVTETKQLSSDKEDIIKTDIVNETVLVDETTLKICSLLNSTFKSSNNKIFKKLEDILTESVAVKEEDKDVIGIYTNSNEDRELLQRFDNQKQVLTKKYTEALRRNIEVNIY
ncbi:DNA polymerase III subunit gamma/tau [Clostridium baratii]|uniref:DNA polymerase III subunit gamma/tau n=1 Tax=Clostridium baratii TaxID=1561 RepID=UPI00069B6476|nr:DNA polymerase III subunit gamma/tau [Clostridium baratii]